MTKITKILANKVLFGLAVTLSIGVLYFVIGMAWISYEINSQCERAKYAYSGDCVTASISLLQDENRSFRERNSAIWVIGQLGDDRALPVLETYYTGIIPDREPLNEMISQYELRKSIKWLREGHNLLTLIWRHSIDQ